MIKVRIIAENPTMRIGLREVIGQFPGMMVESVDSIGKENFADPIDVMVVVLTSNVGVIAHAQSVLYLTDNILDLHKLLDQELPVWGALPTNASEQKIEIAIRALADGLWVGTPGLIGGLFQQKRSYALDENDYLTQPLSERETEVLQLAAEGLSNKQIALQLHISEHTSKFHLSSLYAKLGVASRTEAIRIGVKKGLVVL